MSRTETDLRPRISLGVSHIKQSLEEMVADLEEPITITVAGQRKAVLVPYELYMEMAGRTEEVEVPTQEGGG